MEVIWPPPGVDKEGVLFPTLGPQICDWMEENLVYGPGTLEGEPYKVRKDLRYVLYRAYEHYPDGYMIDYDGEKMDMSGRRRFRFVNISWAKGLAKTETGALVAITELHPNAPVRFNGYDPNAPGGLAPGRSIRSPYIPFLAPTKDQLEDLAYGVAKKVVRNLEDEYLFEVNNHQIIIVGEDESKIIPVAANAGSLDGKKPTFQLIDESHRLFEDRQRQAVHTMQNNLGKRYADDPWQLTITTAGDPSQPSIARDQYRDGVRSTETKIFDTDTFFYHRQTSDANAKFDTMGERIRALKEASGEEASKFRDLASVARDWDKEGEDLAYLERVWCNRWTQASANAFDSDAFKDLGNPKYRIKPGSRITLGFDGAVTQDSTALVATEISTGLQQIFGLWERPEDAKQWQVPIWEVHEAVRMAFEDYDVWRLYFDPPYWQEAGNTWASHWENRVIEWPTRNLNNVYYAVRAYAEAIERGDLAHDGNPDLVRHISNAGKNELNQYDDEGKAKFRLAKISQERKFDAAMAAVLSWQARLDAIKSGEGSESEFLTVPQKLR